MEAGRIPKFVTAIGHFFEAEQLSHKGSPHKTLTALPFDLTAIAHSSHFPSSRVARLFELLGQPTSTRPIKPCRHLLIQGFVRTLLVVGEDPRPPPSVASVRARSELADWRYRLSKCDAFVRARHGLGDAPDE